MAFTYNWQNLTTEVSRLIKGVPVTWPLYCDMVSSDMYTKYPWKDGLQNIIAGTLPLADGVQDYNVPSNLFRLTKASIVRTDTTPNQSLELNVEDDLDVDLVKRSYTSIKAACKQAAVGQIRLESAIAVPAGMLLELQGEFQINSAKITDVNQGLWFQDHYAPVAFAGLLYWGYKLGDDSRAGSASTDGKGRVTYGGQLGEYMALLNKMEQSEDYGSNETYYPSESLGAGRDSGLNVPNIFGW